MTASENVLRVVVLNAVVLEDDAVSVEAQETEDGDITLGIVNPTKAVSRGGFVEWCQQCVEVFGEGSE